MKSSWREEGLPWTVQSEVRTQLPPRAGGEVGIQQRGGKILLYQLMVGREFGEFPSSSCLLPTAAIPIRWATVIVYNCHSVQATDYVTIVNFMVLLAVNHLETNI